MKPTPDAIAKIKEEVVTPAKEVLEHVYQAILRTPEFTLTDGKKARVDAYIPPQVDDDGELTCGFDVLLDNGSHLEFTVRNTGWGKAMAIDPDVKKGKRGRHH